MYPNAVPAVTAARHRERERGQPRGIAFRPLNPGATNGRILVAQV
jgi:hypothetical protein